MAKCGADGPPLLEKGEGGIREIGFRHAIVDVVYCLAAGMKHIGLIETIVAQLIVQYLIGREIAHKSRAVTLKKCIDSKEESGF